MANRKSAPTLEALNAQIAELQAQAEALRAEEVAGVVARIREAIAHYGLTAADLGLAGARAKPARSAGSAEATPKARAERKKPVRTVKFADDQGHSWTGVGKRPNWFKDAIAAGKKPEDLVPKTEA